MLVSQNLVKIENSGQSVSLGGASFIAV